MIDDPLFVSFYTLDTPYEEEAKRLRASLEKFKLPHEVVGIEAAGGWHQNTCLKPGFILQKLMQYERPVVWLDADAEVVAYPELLFNIDEEFAIYECPRYFRTSTIYFDYTNGAMDLVRSWSDLCERHGPDKHTGEQPVLKRAWLEMEPHRPRTLWLPEQYAIKFDARVHPRHPNVIVQHQASRRLKHKV